jgi:hypothetical protein
VITKAIKIITGVVILIILIIFVSTKIRISQEDKQTVQQRVEAELARREAMRVVDKSVYYDFYWKITEGMGVNGRSEISPEETTVELVRQDDKHLWFDQHYLEYGEPETMRIRLTKTDTDSWEGTWEQDNPKTDGHMALDKVGSDTYAGVRTWSSGQEGRCHFKKK